MNPAWSVILFTSVAGMAQGLVVSLALMRMFAAPLAPSTVQAALLIALALLVFALGASFFHLGRPERAWRAVLMWRTSWLSREVIVLPAFIAAVAVWACWGSRTPIVWLALCIALAALLWWCTAQIYACLRFIQEWAHGFTVAAFTLSGLASGALLLCAILALQGDAESSQTLGPWALRALLLAGVVRWLAMRRNAALKPRSTLQSATGIQARDLRQTAMGMSAGSFNTREFFHGRAPALVRQVKHAGLLLGFALPALLVLWAMRSDGAALRLLALAALMAHVPGLLADRWFFFAQARHPQNLYYQVVS